MAELTQSPGRDNPNGKVRSKKASTRIDMTPMVDLAFLLLTFFVLTSALNRPFVMDLAMPDEDENPPPISSKRLLTLVLGEQNKIYWYLGTPSQPRLTDYSRKGIRDVLIKHNVQIKKMIVFIKPLDQSRYQNVVDILDEMAIAHIERYAIVDLTPEDRELIKKSGL
jgi:biopolymer transport protein ExbD